MKSPLWRTGLSAVEPNKILIRGYPVQDLMERATFGDSVFLTFTGRLPAPEQGRMIEAILTSSTDHSVLAPSVNATRFAASGGVPMQAAVASGVIALGEFHGGAIEQCAKMLQEAVPDQTPADALVEAYKSRKQRIPGVGHPIHERDPRTLKLMELASEWNLRGPHLALAATIADSVKLPLNIDGAIAGIISDMGIDWRYGKAFFIISRSVGLSAHFVEEVTRERPFRAVDMETVAYDGPAERQIPGDWKR